MNDPKLLGVAFNSALSFNNKNMILVILDTFSAIGKSIISYAAPV